MKASFTKQNCSLAVQIFAGWLKVFPFFFKGRTKYFVQELKFIYFWDKFTEQMWFEWAFLNQGLFSYFVVVSLDPWHEQKCNRRWGNSWKIDKQNPNFLEFQFNFSIWQSYSLLSKFVLNLFIFTLLTKSTARLQKQPQSREVLQTRRFSAMSTKLGTFFWARLDLGRELSANIPIATFIQVLC